MTRFNITDFQPKAWKILSQSFKADRTAGTYLFSGPDGSGRWALAISLAALLNCEHPIEDSENKGIINACGECRNCRLIFNLNFEGLHFAVPLPPIRKGKKEEEKTIDLISQILETKRQEPFAVLLSMSNTNIPIDIARKIKKSLASRASSGIRRVVIFYQMERMLTASADALLKLIEEPPADTVIILITEKPEMLLPTIQSRAQKIRLRATPSKVVENYLKSYYRLPEIKAVLLTRISQGNPGRAISMIHTEDEEETLRREEAFSLFASLVEDNPPQVVSRLIGSIGEKNRGEAVELLRLWQIFLRDCAGVAVTGTEEGVVNIDMQENIKRLAPYFSSPSMVVNITTHIKNTLADLRLNVHIHGALAALALQIKSEIMYCR